MVDVQCHNLLGEETPQLYAVCGAGPRSSLRILRQGVALSEMAVSPLPGTPNAVFTVRKTAEVGAAAGVLGCWVQLDPC